MLRRIYSAALNSILGVRSTESTIDLRTQSVVESAPKARSRQKGGGVLSNQINEPDELSRLADVARALAQVVDIDAPRLVNESNSILSRLENRRFEIALVGEFNRGKSSLLNLLLERKVVPSGVLPVTSAVTELSHSTDEKAEVRYSDGNVDTIGIDEIESYVTEQANPGNVRHVENVSIMLDAPILRHGAVLMDTPGVGSIFRHNSETARDVIYRADAAIVVLSADTPITEAERSLIRALSRRSEKTFFVLNRVDHLEDDERQKVQWFVESVLREAFGEDQHLYAMSARTKEGYDAFAEAFNEFLATELSKARLTLARRDVIMLSDHIENDCTLEESTLALNGADLERRLGHFKRSIGWQREAFDDDTVIFDHTTRRIVEDLKLRLDTAFAPDDQIATRLAEATRKTPIGELESVLDKVVESEVHSAVEPIRRREELEIERNWMKAAERFEKATQRRAEKLHEIAGELFDIELRPVAITQPANQKGRFFYSPPHNVIGAKGFGRLLGVFTSEQKRRQRMVQAAAEQYEKELQRHLDRLKEDLVARIQDADQNLKSELEARVTNLGEAMTEAIERGQARKSANEQDQAVQKARSSRLRESARKARADATEVIDINAAEAAPANR